MSWFQRESLQNIHDGKAVIVTNEMLADGGLR